MSRMSSVLARRNPERATRAQDLGSTQPVRVCATPGASPSISSATPSVRCTHREPADATTVRDFPRRPSLPSRTTSANGCGPVIRRLGGGGSRPKLHGEGMGGLLQLWLSDEGAAPCGASPLPHGSSLSPPPAQGGRPGYRQLPSQAVFGSQPSRVWDSGRSVSRILSRFVPAHALL